MKRFFAISLALSFSIASRAAGPDLNEFALDERLRIELFAAEPDVIDPVALTFDEFDRMYVVEMRDYPLGIGPDRKPGGVIRLLQDTDADGKADRSTVFARDLSYPTSVAPWNGGIFVTAPPEILYLKDTDGDGAADLREVWFTGFVRGVTDSNVNGLRWGLDNRIHGVNGGNGGTIRALKFPQPPLTLENADFSFDPRTGEIAVTFQSSGGFGLVFDDFGHSFVTYNINHIQQRMMPVAALDRFPGMLPVEGTRSISDHGDMARLFPISQAQTRPNHPEQAGFFSSAGGLGYIGFDAYPGDLPGSLVVGDVVGNLLHRDVLLTNHPPAFTASRSPSERDSEFLASRNNATRMTSLELGPDGALYITDMQRDVIEHPDYIPKKMLDRIELHAGDDRGRIYRITPRDGLPKVPVLGRSSAKQLVAELESHNQARRMTAQRLLIERSAREVAPAVALIAEKSSFAPARVNALWTLDQLLPFTDTTLRHGLHDPHPYVRENALRVLERRQSLPSNLTDSVNRLARDPDPTVRFQAALTLGKVEEDRARQSVRHLALTDRENDWIRTAALSSLRDPLSLLEAAAFTNSVTDRRFLRELTALSVTRSDHPASILAEVLNLIATQPNALIIAALDGLNDGVTLKGFTQRRLAIQPALSRLAKKGEEVLPALFQLVKNLDLPEIPEQKQAVERALQALRNPVSPTADKIPAVRLLPFGRYDIVRESLSSGLNSAKDPELQGETLKALSAFREPDAASELVRAWPVLPPALRGTALNLLLSRRPFHGTLLSAIEKGDLKLGELNLDLEQRRILLRRSSPDIQARAAKLLSDEEYSHRKSVVDEWLPKIPPTGNAAAGKAMFEMLCSQCHRVGTLGRSVGPDLNSISHRSVEDILSNILDPNMAINPKFLTWQIEKKDGDFVTGILESQSADVVTLLQPGEIRSAVPRSQIARMKSTGMSLMPEGLENGMTPAQMRDLIAFLQHPN